MPELSSLEQALLNDLSRDPVWAGICEKIREIPRVPRYRPSKDVPIDKQQADWIYQSGMDSCMRNVLALLCYDR